MLKLKLKLAPDSLRGLLSVGEVWVRCAGFLATGGGPLAVFWEATEDGRGGGGVGVDMGTGFRTNCVVLDEAEGGPELGIAPCLLGGGSGGGPSLCTDRESSCKLLLPTLPGRAAEGS